MSYYNPRVDFAFKKLFGSKENTDILLALVNSILDPEYHLTNLSLVNPYQHGALPIDKTVVLDVLAQDEEGQQYHIEMQVSGDVAYDQRALYYWSKLYHSQLKKGERYRELKKTISIHILNFDFFDQEEGYHHIFRLMHLNSKRHYFEDLELHFIELERFEKTNPELRTALDRWAAFLSQTQQCALDALPTPLIQDDHIVRAFEALETLSLDDEEKMLYDAREKWLRDEASILYNIGKKNRKKGLDEGEQIGLKKGEQIGLKKGEEIAARRIATQLLSAGHTPDAVAQLVGLSSHELLSLEGRRVV